MNRDIVQSYIDGVLACDKRILAKTITLIESTLTAHKELALEIINLLLDRTGKAVRLGITGVPGVGKSTFIESLGMFLIDKGHKVAVMAIDPSSSRSGGSIMADKTRMEQLSVNSQAFIRPSPSGGTLGGVAEKTRETMLVCEAAGFDVIIIETVGVGQSEITVASMVDFFLVLMLSGAGDELQGIKKGVLELADAIAINKADGDNIEKALRARREYANALQFLYPSSPYWNPPVLTCSSVEQRGIEQIWNTVLKHKKIMTEAGEFGLNRKAQALDWMWLLVEQGLKERFRNNPQVDNLLPGLTRKVKSGQLEPTVAASRLLFALDNPEAS